MATSNDIAGTVHGGTVNVNAHSRAARRHLRRAYATEERLRALLDEIPYVSISGESCAELSRAFLHQKHAVGLLAGVEQRELRRYEGLTLTAA